METWIKIDGYPNYSVSDAGRVRNDKFNRILAHRLLNTGYISVMLFSRGKGKQYYIHRLVATAFISNHENKPQVNHINCIKDDNRVENLEWNTHAENMIHARANVKYKHKISTEDVTNIKLLYTQGYTKKAIADKYNVHRSYVGKILNGIRRANG